MTLAKSDASGMFIVRYVFDGCNSVGKWRNKETAEEIALEKIAQYLDIHRPTFYYHYLKIKESLQRSENALVLLTEFCRARKEAVLFQDVMVDCDLSKNTRQRFVVACSVLDLVTTSTA